MRSIDTAVSRLWTLVIRVTVMTAITTAPQFPCGSVGNCSASSTEPFSTIRDTWKGNTTEIAVTTTMATSGPGMLATRAGTQRQATRMAITSSPSTSPGR